MFQQLSNSKGSYMVFFKKVVLLISFFAFISSYSQQRFKAEFGKPTYADRQLKSYEKDPQASAVVLFEKGKNHVELIDNKIRLVKEVHRKIKVLDPSTYGDGVVEILYYKTDKQSEKVLRLKAITHNGDLQNYVAEDAYYDIDYNGNWASKRFTFSNIKQGSILEYTYRIESPFFSNFGGWDFQGDLPKIYSEFNTEVTGNFQYHRALYGSQELYINEVSIKENCFSVPESTTVAECEVAVYAMKDVPAFKKESYMLSKKNYIARLSYELSHTFGFDGLRTTYTKKWRDVDRELKHELEMGIQLGSKSFFKNNIPENILAISDPLEKAKSIYSFIQERMIWNEKNQIFSDLNVKQAFESKSGNTAEINIALINALKAADLKANIMLSSTRDYGLPTTKYPVLTDYNYLTASLKIGEKEYHLDATDKQAPFGTIPFRGLNVRGRVLDFKKGSYWADIKPNDKNVHYVNAQLIGQEDGSFAGRVSEVHTGYIAMDRRKTIISQSSEQYLASKNGGNIDKTIGDLKIENLKKVDEALKENYQIELTPEPVGDKVYLFPFFMEHYFAESPFKAGSRLNPIDFGHPITNTYMVAINLDGIYEVVDLPKGKIYKLPEGSGECSVAYAQENGKINVRLSVKLKEFRYQPEYYSYLKEFFSNVVTMQSKEPIVLKKL